MKGLFRSRTTLHCLFNLLIVKCTCHPHQQSLAIPPIQDTHDAAAFDRNYSRGHSTVHIRIRLSSPNRFPNHTYERNTPKPILRRYNPIQHIRYIIILYPRSITNLSTAGNGRYEDIPVVSGYDFMEDS
jgi:hypothetical protein